MFVFNFELVYLCERLPTLHSNKISAQWRIAGGYVRLFNVGPCFATIKMCSRQFMGRVMRNPVIAYVKTNMQISCAVSAQLFGAFVFTLKTEKTLYFKNTKFQASGYPLLWHGLCRTWSEDRSSYMRSI